MDPFGRIVTTGRAHGCRGTTKHDNASALSNKLTRFEISHFFGISQQVEIPDRFRLAVPDTAKRDILDLWDRYIDIIREVFDKAWYITFDKSFVTKSQGLGIRIFAHFHL